MNRVAIIGVGMTKVGRSSVSGVDLFVAAAKEAISDAGISPRDIQALYIGNVFGEFTEQQGNIGPLAATRLGLAGIPTARFESACASSSVAFRNAYHAVRGGSYRVVLVGGTERLRTVDGSTLQEVFGLGMDRKYEAAIGNTFGGVFALMARAHMAKYGTTEQDLAAIAVKNHFHGKRNPRAQFQQEITMETVLNSAKVADPIKLYDCCPFSDGASALIMVSGEVAKDFPNRVCVEGSGQGTDRYLLSERSDLTFSQATYRAAQEAFAQAGLKPADVDVAEVHDCVTINEILGLEALGFYPPGEGRRAAVEGNSYLGGRLPVNTSGGLKSRGHPIGATGVAQMVEIFDQLCGRAEGRQVPNAEIGLTQNVGGTGTVATVHVFRKY